MQGPPADTSGLAADPDELAPGTVLGPYRIRSLRGLGAMGAVYEAEDEERGRRVALKTLRRFGAETLLQLKEEFRAVADIQHENLVEMYELMSVDGVWFFTMELVDGVDFAAYARKAAPEEFRAALRGVARGVDALHEAGCCTSISNPRTC